MADSAITVRTVSREVRPCLRKHGCFVSATRSDRLWWRRVILFPRRAK